MMNNFANCLAVTIQPDVEGGFVNNRHDPGGATDEGVTQAVYDTYRRSIGLKPQSVSKIKPSEVQAIYKSLYWNKVHGDDLPIGVDMIVFDIAVNSGPGEAIKLLQEALGVSVDGQIGPQTIAAAQKIATKAQETAEVEKIEQERLAFWAHLKNYAYFKKGWQRRGALIEKAALAMIGSSKGV